jgi:hypothetical protein
MLFGRFQAQTSVWRPIVLTKVYRVSSVRQYKYRDDDNLNYASTTSFVSSAIHYPLIIL